MEGILNQFKIVNFLLLLLMHYLKILMGPENAFRFNRFSMQLFVVLNLQSHM